MEYLNECSSTQRKAFLEGGEGEMDKRGNRAEGNILAIRKFLIKKHRFDWNMFFEASSIEKLWGKGASIDDFLVILGTRHEIADNVFTFLGETDFRQEHYTELNSKVEFCCWSHEVSGTDNMVEPPICREYKDHMPIWYQLLNLMRPTNYQFTERTNEADFIIESRSDKLPTYPGGKYEFTEARKGFLKLPPKLSFSVESKKFFTSFYTVENTLYFRPFVPPTETEVVIDGTKVRLKNVVADGNCGVWALAQALQSEQDFLHPTFSQVQNMQKLRARAAKFVPSDKKTTCSRIAMSAFCASDLEHWIYTDDFRYFSQVIGQSIGIIVCGDGYRIYEPDGREFIFADMLAFRTYLRQHPRTLTIGLIGNHYQTVTDIQNSPLSAPETSHFVSASSSSSASGTPPSSFHVSL